MARSLSDVMTSFLTFLGRRQPSLELAEGTPENDLFIRAQSIEFEKSYAAISQVSQEQSIQTASDDGMDRIASNLTVLRKGSVRARVEVILFRRDPPSSTFSVPVATIVSTSTSGGVVPVQFQTTEVVTMVASLAATYLNPVTGLYEIPAEAEAITPGRAGLVGASTINTLTTPVAGIDGVYNPQASFGGIDRESTTGLAGRLAKALAGINIGTVDGYYRLVVAQDGVEDALVIGNGDSPRDSVGAIDIVIKGKSIATWEDTFTPPFASVPFYFTPTKQPIVGEGFASLVDSNLGPQTQGGVWDWVSDTSELGGSVRGQDQVFVSAPPAGLGTQVLTYQYNSLVTQLQALVDLPQNKIHNSDPLVVWATETPINITLNIKVLPGYDVATVKAAVSSAMTDLLSGALIGQEVQQADVARVVLNTPGVDDVQLPFTTFQSSDGSVTRNSVGNLVLPAHAYAFPGTFTIGTIS